MADNKSRLPWKRIGAAAAAALSTGIAISRNAASREIDKQKASAIAETADIARGRIRGSAQDYLASSFRGFALNIFIKAIVLSTVWIAKAAGWISPEVFGVMIATCLGAFIMRDAWTNWPSVRMAFGELRRHGWKPKTTISEVVAAQVFDEVLAEASVRKTTLSAQLVMALAGTNRAGLEAEVAHAVADIARDVTWDDIRPFIVAAAVKFALLMALYSLFVFLVVHAI